MTAYRFRERLGAGVRGEAFLDRFFATGFVITEANRQREGIDRIFSPRDGKPTFTVEYKTDYTGVRTHNMFVETVSVDRENKPGWAIASQADWLIYYLPTPEDLIYAICFSDLRANLDYWRGNCPERAIPNQGSGGPYNTVGLLVPQAEFERIATSVIDASTEIVA